MLGEDDFPIVSTNVEDIGKHNVRIEIVNRIRRVDPDVARILETRVAITTKSQLARYIAYRGKMKKSRQGRNS